MRRRFGYQLPVLRPVHHANVIPNSKPTFCADVSGVVPGVTLVLVTENTAIYVYI
ncbi:hypothetical protein [Calothrix sp. PCC 6303]|uniref:hypothetical protein n=1 Tax=Calothrix sp. PCC 6303 TaxID=1170562 RepID=UPI0002A027D0|nr:hypothetical protein [Calothrix sp. PCC 6303]AFZ02913.1 hypothetical protein Cal6303_3997 [Calothrix sp. PCC 6303]